MTSASPPSACFLGNPGERIFNLHYQPKGSPMAHILFLPALGEEMNRCRALVAEQARQFSAVGYSCTIMDFRGTGESDGELQEASFDAWRKDIARVLDLRLGECVAPVILWACRLGGLIALDFCSKGGHEIQDIILWQPVSSGKRYLNQMLRQRVAGRVGQGLSPETTQEIRQRLAHGEPVEISGYLLGKQLAEDIERVDLSVVGELCSGTIFWLENVADVSQEVSISVQKAIDSLRQKGNRVQLHRFSDPPLWQLHKRDEAQQLLEMTTGLVS